MNREGARFYLQVDGLGRRRALRLLRWLTEREEILGVHMRSSLRALVEPLHIVVRTQEVAFTTSASATGFALLRTSSMAMPAAVTPATPTREFAARNRGTFALVPLEKLDWPDHLAGGEGGLRAREDSILLVQGRPVRDDREALEQFRKDVVHAGKSPHTVRAYESAIERLVLWALLERKTALSSLGRADLRAFVEFLYAPPAHWCSSARVLKTCDEWRPLRGPLSEKAVRQITDVIKQLYAYWHANGYLRANPAHKLNVKSSDATQRVSQHGRKQLDASRSFAREDLQLMAHVLNEREQGPSTNRLRAILSLFVDSGVRRSEVEMLTLGDAVPVRDDFNSLSDMRQITVLGKGDKLREVPITERTLQLLDCHYQDRLRLVASKKLPAHFGQIARERTPVLSVLAVRAQKASERRGATPASADRIPTEDGRLDSKTLYAILKKFFREVAARPELPSRVEHFERACTHWLRHTFALQYLAHNPGDLSTLRDLLGHANISTTNEYLDQHAAKRALGVARMVRFF